LCTLDGRLPDCHAGLSGSDHHRLFDGRQRKPDRGDSSDTSNAAHVTNALPLRACKKIIESYSGPVNTDVCSFREYSR
jgi:hypothetical protein